MTRLFKLRPLVPGAQNVPDEIVLPNGRYKKARQNRFLNSA